MKNRKLRNTRRGRSKIRQAKTSQPKKNPDIKDLPIGRAIKGILRVVKRGTRRVVTFRPAK